MVALALTHPYLHLSNGLYSSLFMFKLASVLLLISSVFRAQEVRVPDLSAKSLYYSKESNLLYAAVGATSPYMANTIAIIDPSDGSVAGSIPVGLDPGQMAASDDGQYLYVALDGENRMQRIRLADGTPEPEFAIDFPIETSSVISYLPRVTLGLKVIHGTPDTIAVVQGQRGGGLMGIAVYRNGVQLPKITSPSVGCSDLAYGATPDTLWCFSYLGQLYKLYVDDQGISVAGNPLLGLSGVSCGNFQFHGRLLYCNTGPPHAIDPENALILGSYSNWETRVGTGGFAVDEDAGVIYFARRDGYWTLLYSFDLTRFTVMGVFVSGLVNDSENPGMAGQPQVLILCGPEELAAIDSENGHIFFFNRSQIRPLIIPPPTVTDLGNGARMLSLLNNEIAYDPNSDRILAATPNAPGGNTLVAVDPASLTPGPQFWIGSDPSHMAISPDGRYLYQSLGGEVSIRRVDLKTWTTDLWVPVRDVTEFPFAAYFTRVTSLLVLPGSGESIAVAQGRPGFRTTLAIYDGTTPRPVIPGIGDPPVDVIQLDSSGRRLFTLDNQDTSFAFATYAIGPDGVYLQSKGPRSGGFYADMKCQNDVCFTTAGDVIDTRTNKKLGRCNVDRVLANDGVSAVLPDVPNRRVYFGGVLFGVNEVVLTSCNLDTFLPAETVAISGPASAPRNLLFWRSDQLAFASDDGIVTVPKAAFQPIPPAPLPVPALRGPYVHLSLPHNAAAYDAVQKKLYVAVPPASLDEGFIDPKTYGNSIAIVDPATGTVKSTIPVGGNPVALDVCDDGSCLWVQLGQADTVLRLNLLTASVDYRIVLPAAPTALRVQPGHPESVVIAYGTKIGLYVKGVAVGNAADLGLASTTSSIEFGPDTNTVYADSTLPVNRSFVQLRIGPSGLSLQQIVTPAFLGEKIHRAGNRFYDDVGHVFDVQSLQLVGQTRLLQEAAVDSQNGRLYGSFPNTLYAYDTDGLTLIGTWPLSFYGLFGPPRGWVPCGPDRIAGFSTGIDFYTFDTITPGLPTPR